MWNTTCTRSFTLKNFTCWAFQLTVVWLLCGVYVFLDQKRSWHLGKRVDNFSKLFFFFLGKYSGARQFAQWRRKSLLLKSSEVSWCGAALLETVQRVAVKSSKYSPSGAWEESCSAIYIYCELKPIKSRFNHGALKRIDAYNPPTPPGAGFTPVFSS